MGQSTNAIIAFGFDLGEELPDALAELLRIHERDTDKVLIAASNIGLPDYNEVGHDIYCAAFDKAESELKIDLIEHCSAEYPMYFLAVRGSAKTANRGFPKALDDEDLDASKFHEGGDAMYKFCTKHGIEWQAPQWHIFSMWS